MTPIWVCYLLLLRRADDLIGSRRLLREVAVFATTLLLARASRIQSSPRACPEDTKFSSRMNRGYKILLARAPRIQSSPRCYKRTRAHTTSYKKRACLSILSYLSKLTFQTSANQSRKIYKSIIGYSCSRLEIS